MPLRLRPRGERAQALRIPRQPLRHHLDQVLARVRVLGQLGRLAQRLPQPHVHRPRQRHELVARVVDVVPRLDAVALAPEDARERVAHRGRARVDDHERAGRIGRDELEDDAGALPGVRPAVVRARGQHLVEAGRAPARREEDVQEAGARDLEALDRLRLREVGHHRLGDLAGRAAGLARQRHRGVGRIVAVPRFTRDLPLHLGGCGQPGGVERVPQCVRQMIGDVQRQKTPLLPGGDRE